MKITADTNVLIRAAVRDDVHQARKAAKIMQEAELVAVPIPVLCEFVWVLRRGYKKPVLDISDAIRRLMNGVNVVLNRPAVEAGLSVLDSAEISRTVSLRMKVTGWVEKSLCPSTRRLSLYCSPEAVVPACFRKS